MSTEYFHDMKISDNLTIIYVVGEEAMHVWKFAKKIEIKKKSFFFFRNSVWRFPQLAFLFSTFFPRSFFDLKTKLVIFWPIIIDKEWILWINLCLKKIMYVESRSYKTFFSPLSDFCWWAWVFVTYKKKIIVNKIS